MPFVVAEQNRELVEELRAARPAGGGRRCRRSGGADPGAHRARPHAGDRDADTFHVRADDRDGARAQSGDRASWCAPTTRKKRALLREENAGTVFIGEHELAQAMLREAVVREPAAAGGLQAAGARH